MFKYILILYTFIIVQLNIESLFLSGAPEFTPVMWGSWRSIFSFLCSVFVDHCLSCCPLSIGHCIVCPSSFYGFWLPLWYLLVILVTPLVSSVYPFGIFWLPWLPLWYLLVTLVTPFVSSGYPGYPFGIFWLSWLPFGIFWLPWLPLWYLLVILVTPLVSSGYPGYPFGIFRRF